jgi:hypothetical protein
MVEIQHTETLNIIRFTVLGLILMLGGEQSKNQLAMAHHSGLKENFSKPGCRKIMSLF